VGYDANPDGDGDVIDLFCVPEKTHEDLDGTPVAAVLVKVIASCTDILVSIILQQCDPGYYEVLVGKASPSHTVLVLRDVWWTTRFTLWKLTGHFCARPFPVWLGHSSYRLLYTLHTAISSHVRLPFAMLVETLTIIQTVYRSLSIREESRGYHLFVTGHLSWRMEKTCVQHDRRHLIPED
jgi:hypothetical protein